MKNILSAWALLCLLFLSGCVVNGVNLSLSGLGLDAGVDFEQLLEEQHFSEAYALLADIRNDPYFSGREAQMEEQLQKRSQQFEKDVLASSGRSIKKGQWQETQKIFDDALDKYPTSVVIQEAQGKFIVFRDVQLSKIEFRLLQNEARLLIDNSSLEQRTDFILGIANEHFPDLDRLQERKNEVGKRILDFVVSAIDDGNYDQAIYTLGLIAKLDSVGLDENVYSRVRNKIAKVVARRKRQKNAGTVVLMDDLNKGYTINNLRRAKKHLDMLKAQKQKYPTAYKLYPNLKKLYEIGMQKLIRKGSVLYSQGKIKEALAQWQPIFEVDCDFYPLSDYIKRAKQVLRKVQSLRAKE